MLLTEVRRDHYPFRYLHLLFRTVMN